jgi:hypothetical protein
MTVMQELRLVSVNNGDGHQPKLKQDLRQQSTGNKGSMIALMLQVHMIRLSISISISFAVIKSLLLVTLF